MDILIYKFCVEVFEKTLSRAKIIDHSFERKFYGRIIRYSKMFCAVSVARNARIKFYNGSFTMMLFTNLYENYTIAFFSRCLKNCWILKTVYNNNNYNNNYFRRYYANYVLMHVINIIKKILNRFTTFLLLVNESIKETVRKILNFSKLINYY